MARHFEKMLSEDLNVGISPATKRNPGGGTLTGTQIGLHTFARGGAKVTTTWDPPNVVAGASTTTTVTVTGATLGDFVAVSFSLSLSGLVLTAYVSAVNTVTVVLSNPTGSPVDLSSGTLAVTVFAVK
jgi:hypothetical protein